MKLLARVTAAVFLGLGAILVLAGIGWALVILIKGAPPANPSPFFGNYAHLLRLMRLVGAGAVAFQGLLLAAAGEALWLLTDIAERSS